MMAISRAFLFRTRISAAINKMAENKMASRRLAGYIFLPRAKRAAKKLISRKLRMPATVFFYYH